MDKNEEINNINHILRICDSATATSPEEAVQHLLAEPHVQKFVSDLHKQGMSAQGIVQEVRNECKMHKDTVKSEIVQEEKKGQSQSEHGHKQVIVVKIQKSNDIRTNDGPYIFNGDHHMLYEILKDFSQMITVHSNDEPNSKERHGEKTLYPIIEIQSMSFVEVLQAFYNNGFTMNSNSTYKIDKTTIQELIFLRNDAMVRSKQNG